MLKTLIRKEITETILDLRFWIVTALFLVLIPLGMYVSRKDYESRLANYQREHGMYRQHYGKDTGPSVEAQGFRPPSVLSIFALGLDPFMPDKAITSRSGLVRAAKEPGIDNPESLLFGKADFLFNVSFIVSLAALIFTFNRISGLAGTVPTSPDKFTENAERYQEQVKAAIYDNWILKTYHLGGSRATSAEKVDGFDPSKVSVPEMRYEYTTIAEVVRTDWIDILRSGTDQDESI